MGLGWLCVSGRKPVAPGCLSGRGLRGLLLQPPVDPCVQHHLPGHWCGHADGAAFIMLTHFQPALCEDPALQPRLQRESGHRLRPHEGGGTLGGRGEGLRLCGWLGSACCPPQRHRALGHRPRKPRGGPAMTVTLSAQGQHSLSSRSWASGAWLPLPMADPVFSRVCLRGWPVPVSNDGLVCLVGQPGGPPDGAQADGAPLRRPCCRGPGGDRGRAPGAPRRLCGRCGRPCSRGGCGATAETRPAEDGEPAEQEEPGAR